jgi:hypothetical protein
MPDPFYLVWSPTGPTPPRVRHASRAEAKAEAERLARINRGTEFFVVCATDRLLVDDLRHDRLVAGVEDIPF